MSDGSTSSFVLSAELLPPHDGPVGAVCVLAGDIIATGGDDCLVRMWSPVGPVCGRGARWPVVCACACEVIERVIDSRRARGGHRPGMLRPQSLRGPRGPSGRSWASRLACWRGFQTAACSSVRALRRARATESHVHVRDAGSQDKCIRGYTPDGVLVRSLKGHTGGVISLGAPSWSCRVDVDAAPAL
jgi:hypothetical protein